MKAVDVSNEVKKESQVNAAKEDTAVKTQVESQLKDTVEWVESTKTPVDGAEGDGDYKYEKIDNSTIVNPIKFSFANGTFYKTALFFVEGEGTPDDSGTETSKPAASSEASTQPKEKTQEEIDAEEAAKKAKEEADRKQKEQEEAEKEKQRQQEEAEKQKQKEEADRKAKEEAEKKANKERILVNGKEGAYVSNLKNGGTEKITITDGENNAISGINVKVEDGSIATLADGNTIKAGDKEGKTFITLSYGSYKACSITVNVKKDVSKELSVGNIVTVGANVVVTPNVQGNGKAVNYTLELKNSGDSAYLQIVDKKSASLK